MKRTLCIYNVLLLIGIISLLFIDKEATYALELQTEVEPLLIDDFSEMYWFPNLYTLDRLDYTTNEYVYSDGKEWIEKEEDSIQLVYEYDQNGNRISVEFLDANGNQKIYEDVAKTLFSYDARGNVQSISFLNKYNSPFSTSYEYVYGTRNEKIKEICYSEGEVDHVTEWAYNDEGLVSKVMDYSGSGELEETTEYVYDAEGRLMSGESIATKNGKTIKKFVLTYDTNGHVIQKDVYEAVYNETVSTFYEYSSDGKQVKASQFKEDGSLEELFLGKCDDEGKITECIRYNSSGTYSTYVTYPKNVPMENYDEIVKSDGRYYLCRKQEVGFSVDQELFGIYDTSEGNWVIDGIQLDEKDRLSEMVSCGDGVFIFAEDTYYNNISFLSADAGGVFTIESCAIDRHNIRFVNGEAIILIYIENGFKDGRILPNEGIYKVSTDGTKTEINLANLGSKEDRYYYCDDSLLYGKFSKDVFATRFHSDGEYYVYIYLYDKKYDLLISDQECVSRMTSYIGNEEDNSDVSLIGNILRIDRLEGDDGEYYYTDYSLNGERLAGPTKMTDGFFVYDLDISKDEDVEQNNLNISGKGKQSEEQIEDGSGITVIQEESQKKRSIFYAQDGRYETVEYDDLGRTTERKWYEPTGELRYWYEYVYDDSNYKGVGTRYNNDGSEDGRIEYTYNENWKKQSGTKYNQKNELRYYRTYTYDKNGILAESARYGTDGVLEEKTLFGPEECEKQYIAYKEDGSIDYQRVSKLDESQNQVKFSYIDGKDNLLYWYTSSYDDENRRKEITWYRGDDTLCYQLLYDPNIEDCKEVTLTLFDADGSVKLKTTSSSPEDLPIPTVKEMKEGPKKEEVAAAKKSKKVKKVKKKNIQIFRDSSSRYLDRTELVAFSAAELRLARNEIYARHGRRFKDEELQKYFDACSWYEGTIAPDQFDESVLNKYEKKNVEIILQAENGEAEYDLLGVDELHKMAETYFHEVLGKWYLIVELGGYDDEYVYLHVYEQLSDHTSTYVWWNVDRYTGIASDVIKQEEVDYIPRVLMWEDDVDQEEEGEDPVEAVWEDNEVEEARYKDQSWEYGEELNERGLMRLIQPFEMYFCMPGDFTSLSDESKVWMMICLADETIVKDNVSYFSWEKEEFYDLLHEYFGSEFNPGEDILEKEGFVEDSGAILHGVGDFGMDPPQVNILSFEKTAEEEYQARVSYLGLDEDSYTGAVTEIPYCEILFVLRYDPNLQHYYIADCAASQTGYNEEVDAEDIGEGYVPYDPEDDEDYEEVDVDTIDWEDEEGDDAFDADDDWEEDDDKDSYDTGDDWEEEDGEDSYDNGDDWKEDDDEDSYDTDDEWEAPEEVVEEDQE